MTIPAACPSAADVPVRYWMPDAPVLRGGDRLDGLRIAYRTIGDPAGDPVLLLHGTNGSGASLLTPAFAGELFGPGQPLDLRRHFVVLPDALGAGGSSKPSDGLRARFPRYDYDDMVDLQHRLIVEHLGLARLRLVLGYSMGGMHAWLWGVRHPSMMDALVPMAATPGPMSGRNWMMRRMLCESIRRDPAWRDGDYVEQPPAFRLASLMYAVGTNFGEEALARRAPTRALADGFVDERLAAPFEADANDHLWQWDASRSYDPTSGLERIEASVLAINADDDERNPPQLPAWAHAMRRLRDGRLLRIPAGEGTAGHATCADARTWKDGFAEWFEAVPRRG